MPFHTSASVKASMALLLPTAAHELGDVQDTPASEMFVGLAGFGVGCTFQRCPLQFSATVSWPVGPK